MVARGAQWLGRVWKNFPCGELCHTTFFPFISRADCDTFCPNCGGTVLFASKQVNGALLNQLFNTRLEAFMWWSGVNACQPSFLKLLPWIFCVVCCNSGSVWSICWRARRRLAHLVKRDKDQWTMDQVARFNGAWFRRDFGAMWKVARVLSGRQIGPKHRVYSRPISMRPNLDDWAAHLALPGHLGGWKAQRVQSDGSSARSCWGGSFSFRRSSRIICANS